MWKSIKLLMVLVLFAGVTACSGTETESETVEEAPVEEVAEDAAFACYWLDPASNAWVSMDDLTTEEACVEMDSCSGGGGRSGGGCYTWSDEPPAVEEAAASPGLDEWGVPGDKIETFTIERGQPVDVTDSRGTQIKIDADKLVDENGNLPEGDLTLSMYTYDLSSGEMPGDMSGKNTDGEAVAMESAGAFYASFEDAEGNAFNTVADGATAEISVPVTEEMVREEPPTVWSYDPSTGLWIEEGVAEYGDLAYGENTDAGTMAMGSAGTVFFASYVSGAGNALNTNAPSSVAQQGEMVVGRLISLVLHFSAWNFDWEMRDSACINLSLPQAYLDANSPVSVRALKADGQALDNQLSDVENVLYNLPANTDVSLYIPKDASAPFATVNTGAAWGGTGAPPAPDSACVGVQFEPPSAAGGLVYGTGIHLQNQYEDEQTYLDTRGRVMDKPQFAEVAQTERTFVSTHSSPNRSMGSGTWTIESAEGKTKGDAVAIGDAIFLVNGYPGTGYLDTWGYTDRHPVWDDIADSTLGVYTTLDRSRIDDERTATWYIRSAAGKADGEPVAEGDPIHLESAYDNPNPGMPDGGFLDTNSNVTPYTEFSEYEGQRFFVFTSPMEDRDRGSGTWIMRVAETTSADAADDAPEAAASTGPVTLEGQVVSATTGEPISGVEVCHDTSGDCATSSDTGTFVIEQAAPGPVTLSLAHDDHADIDHSFVHSGEGHFEKVAMSPNLATGEIRIVLTWSRGSDVDSHLWLPESSPYEVYYLNKGASDGPPNAILDIDDTNDGGPETITINERVDGTYHFAVKHFDCFDFEGVCDVAGKSPVVQVYGEAGLVEEFNVPTGVGEWWHVFSLDGLSGEVTPINVIQAARPVTYQ